MHRCSLFEHNTKNGWTRHEQHTDLDEDELSISRNPVSFLIIFVDGFNNMESLYSLYLISFVSKPVIKIIYKR